MRVLFLSLHFAPDTVSNAVVVTELAEELAARGHTVTVVAAMPYHQRHAIEDDYRGRVWRASRHGNIRVIRAWLLLRGDKTEVGKRFVAYASFNLTSTLAALASGPYDLVITPSPPLTVGVCGWLVARAWGARFVYNVQDIYPDAAIKLGLLRSRRAIRFFRWMERFVYARADAVTVISEDFRHNLLSKGVEDSKIVLIPNPVDTGFIRPLSPTGDFAREHDLGGRFVVLYAGNVGLAQGLGTLVRAAQRFADPDLQVLIVGAGAELAQVKAEAISTGVANRVRVLPFQPRDRVPDLYASADVCVVLLRAGMGNTSTPSKLFTIMAAGRPVIASVDRGSEVWRLVEAADCGVCVPPEDPVALAAAIEAMRADPTRARELGQRGRAFVERTYGRARVGEQYDQLAVGLSASAGGSRSRTRRWARSGSRSRSRRKPA